MSSLACTLDYCGKKRFTSPSIELISEQLSSLNTDDAQFIILHVGEDFIQCYVSETFGEVKLYAVEYKDDSKNILYEAEGTFGFEKTLELFNLFLNQDDSLKRAAPWIDSGIPMTDDNAKNSIKSKLYFLLALLAPVVVYTVIKAL